MRETHLVRRRGCNSRRLWQSVKGRHSTDLPMKKLAGTLILFAVVSFSFTGCQTQNSENDRVKAGRPRLQSIGDASPIVVFRTNKLDELSIPIRGQDLTDLASTISVDVQPSGGLKPGLDYYLDYSTNSGTSSSLIFLKFSSNAISGFKSLDRLAVNLTISDNPPNNGMLRNEFEMSSLSADVMGRPLTEKEKKEIQTGDVSKELARLLGYKAYLAQWTTNQVLVLSNWLAAQTIDKGTGKETSSWSPTDLRHSTNNVAETNWMPGTNKSWTTGSPLMARPALDDSKSESSAVAFNEGFQQARAMTTGETSVKRRPNRMEIARLSRNFILYNEDDYRGKILAGQINYYNITAESLNQNETRKLFGGFIARNFFAVRLTLHNPTDQDQVVSICAIKAYGWARVAGGTNSGPAFTIPIELEPQSEQQLYTMVQNAKGDFRDEDSVRDWIFGTLEFAGAMAAAYGTGFGASADYVKAVALSTGTAIPGLEKLWADKRPFHLLCLNNFAMPDVIKIPKGGGSVDGKYLFFSKGKIQGILQDPDINESDIKDWDKKTKLQKADFYSAAPVTVAFDSMQIPFENTFIPAVSLITNLQPSVAVSPVSQIAPTNTSPSFNATASNLMLPVGYQWYFGTNALTGETNPQLKISNVKTNSAGDYYIVVTNSSCVVTSPVVKLIVN